MRQNPRIVQKILLILALLGLVIGFGTLGYCWIEGWNWFDGLYMTIITLATIGYGETHPLNLHGRIFTLVLILLGSGVMVYAISTVTAFVVEGDLREALRRRRMEQIINRLSDHFVICGAGQTGMYVVEEMHKIGRSFIVIENDPGKIQTLKNRGIPCLLGDATHDETLQQAGVGRALGLISTLHTDAENLFVVLTAKAIQPQLRIIAKATEETSRAKITASGCRFGGDAQCHRRHAHGVRNGTPQCGRFFGRHAALRPRRDSGGRNQHAQPHTLAGRGAGRNRHSDPRGCELGRHPPPRRNAIPVQPPPVAALACR